MDNTSSNYINSGMRAFIALAVLMSMILFLPGCGFLFGINPEDLNGKWKGTMVYTGLEAEDLTDEEQEEIDKMIEDEDELPVSFELDLDKDGEGTLTFEGEEIDVELKGDTISGEYEEDGDTMTYELKFTEKDGDYSAEGEFVIEASDSERGDYSITMSVTADKSSSKKDKKS